MWYHFFLQNIHFAINMMAALVLFAICWLYYDAQRISHGKVEVTRALGFLLLSCSFIIHAVFVESGLLEDAVVSEAQHTTALLVFRIAGYLFVVLSLILEPLQPKPKESEAPSPEKTHVAIPLGLLSWGHGLFPLLSLLGAGLYFRRATTGLERHIMPMAAGFGFLTVAEVLSLRSVWGQTTNVSVFYLTAPFGPLWVMEHGLLVIAIVIMARWVFGYLLKRFDTELFMIFTTSILGIYLLTAVTFTGLLVNNLVGESLRQLETDAKVLQYAIESKKTQTLSEAEAVAQDPRIIDALTAGKRTEIADIASIILGAKKLTSLTVVDADGSVVARGEDKTSFGEKATDDLVTRRSLAGETGSTVQVTGGVTAPTVSVVSAVPIVSGEKMLGSITVSSIIDSAFLDGMKKATGLDASVYGLNVLSATTLIASDGVTRPIGILEETPQVKTQTLTEGRSYVGGLTLLSMPYFAAYLPLLDMDNNPVGLLFVGRPQTSILEAASRSIEVTFLVTVALMIVSVIPSYMVAKFIARQV